VNNLVGYAHTTGEILIQSDGTPWRPLGHVEDIAAAILAVLHAPRASCTTRRSTSGRVPRTTASGTWPRSSRTSCRERARHSRTAVGRTSAPIGWTARRSGACCPSSRPLDRAPGRRGTVRRLGPQRPDLRGVHRRPLPAYQPGARAAGGRPARRRPAPARVRRLTLNDDRSGVSGAVPRSSRRTSSSAQAATRGRSSSQLAAEVAVLLGGQVASGAHLVHVTASP
jgi:hypothetical protein